MKYSFLLSLSTFCFFALPATSAEVDVYLLGGQSNMEGQGAVAELTKDQTQFANDVFFWNGNEFEPLIVGQTRTSNRPERFGLEISFAQETAKSGGPIYIVKYSASGMPLHHGWHRNAWEGGDAQPKRVNFYPGESPEDPNRGTLYIQMMQRFRTALSDLEKQGHTANIKAFLWMQGEQDSKNEVSATSYAESLRRLYSRVKEDVGAPHMKLIFGQVLPYEEALPRFTHRQQIREQMAAADSRKGAPEAIPGAFMVPTEGCPLKPDTVHHDTEGYWMLGQKFARVLQGEKP